MSDAVVMGLSGIWLGAKVTVRTFFRTRRGWETEIGTTPKDWKEVVEKISVYKQFKIMAPLKPIRLDEGGELNPENPEVFTGQLKTIEVKVTYEER